MCAFHTEFLNVTIVSIFGFALSCLFSSSLSLSLFYRFKNVLICNVFYYFHQFQYDFPQIFPSLSHFQSWRKTIKKDLKIFQLESLSGQWNLGRVRIERRKKCSSSWEYILERKRGRGRKRGRTHGSFCLVLIGLLSIISGWEMPWVLYTYEKNNNAQHW